MKLFGSTIKETSDALSYGASKKTNTNKKDKDIAIGRIVISVLLFGLAAGLFFTNTSKDAADVIVGALVGYWLK